MLLKMAKSSSFALVQYKIPEIIIIYIVQSYVDIVKTMTS